MLLHVMFFVALKIVTYVRKEIIITIHNGRCGKVMFSQVCVKNSVGGDMCSSGAMCGRGGHAWQGVCMAGGMYSRAGMHGRGCAWQGGIGGRDVDGSSRRDGHCSGRYASYWNAFLLLLLFYRIKQ